MVFDLWSGASAGRGVGFVGCKGAGEFVRVFSCVPSMFDPLDVKALFPTRWRKPEREGVAGKPRDLSNDRRQKTPILFGLAEVSRGEVRATSATGTESLPGDALHRMPGSLLLARPAGCGPRMSGGVKRGTGDVCGGSPMRQQRWQATSHDFDGDEIEEIARSRPARNPDRRGCRRDPRCQLRCAPCRR